MPKRTQQKQKQKQTVIVNIHSTKKKTKRKGGRRGGGKGGSQQSMILPPPIYTTPIHNLTPQIFGDGKQLKIPTLAEQQINKQTNEQMKNEMDKSLISKMNKKIDEELFDLAKGTKITSENPFPYGLDDLSKFSTEELKSMSNNPIIREQQKNYGLYHQVSDDDNDTMSSISNYDIPIRTIHKPLKKQDYEPFFRSLDDEYNARVNRLNYPPNEDFPPKLYHKIMNDD